MTKKYTDKTTHRLSKNTGMSMLEIIVALGILSAGMMGIVQMHFQDMKQTRALQEAYVVERLIENEWAFLQFDPEFSGDSGDQTFRHGYDPEALRELHTQVRWIKKENGLMEVHLQVRWASTLGRMKEEEATMLLKAGGQTL